MADHTPGPWTYHFRSGDTTIETLTGDRVLAVVKSTRGESTRGVGDMDTNARFIVQACNAHEELLAALTKIATAPEGAYSRDKEQYLKNVIEWCQETAQAAIAKTQGFMVKEA
mgnify:CR=1 FL=1